ncbi:bifunctional 3-(3-hydroxy-phenyl)propionate/3-hydroxycinnamic acid hydroxylase [Streptomyces sp. H10-C2]|uniref:bifunctional 3-(3-hydroxy-phenyl)propionate/3-hydroxycinnamic acid hydroxylase MhpA n=1 Tax=unclassified Streptomyces TaxID=2593676 RepID=UPI0024BA854F|nr:MULTISPECIES: bifunctional 3-(3-hydroxy-phenyl)propionate/3-hydroxycinnamic acid hydroxylase [unclassified Streptomyces]MDJ0346859.1 bifunctional 3-(3-hydroxy-phenyl)propionate/3-hydroxycinnamic acid hydroxylase [Streptomyces sp. PH10-H1]MDJ0372864.1 bifunctional 3-(3-hydroxy-phenyl)propionate/3-hydroxycinnamic acid hydroxylase [Streptomyces sp. H10-C2]
MHTSPVRSGASHEDDADLLIVGYGPVGQVLANLMAQRGWRVTVVERHPRPYTMPRAVAFDGEAARILAAAGVGDHLTRVGEASGDYLWQNGKGEDLLYIGAAEEHGRNGWPESTSMYQPGLESALAARGARIPGLSVLRGFEAVELAEVDDGVELVVQGAGGERRTIAARWIVGCDGANSFVRDRIGTGANDLGFAYDWLICDVVLHDGREFTPNNLQICDPARPRTQVSAGPGHRRWEFMRLPGESKQELNTVETAWRMLSLFGITRDDGIMERHAVYTFQASCALKWRSRRQLIAGDAAHLMPPFAGQGMSSGFRDAANIVWKLDLVLRGVADESLLDTYTTERWAHVQHAIGMSVNLGKVICQTDPAAAGDRDTIMIATRERNLARPQQSPFQPLTKGLLGRDPDGKRLPGAGDQVPQPRVARGAASGLFDEIVGRGFALVSLDDPRDVLDVGRLEFLESIGAHLVHLLPSGTPAGQARGGAVVDTEGTCAAYLDGIGARGVLVRPDFYVFGGAVDAEGSLGLVDALRDALPETSLTGSAAGPRSRWTV